MSRRTFAAMTWPAAVALIMGAENPLRRRHATHDLVTAGFLIVAALLLPTSVLAQSGQVVDYYHLDALGSVRVVTDQTGQVVARHDFLPFGEEWNPPGNAKEKKLFTGHERDADTGLDYFGARYYRPQVGRFTTIDPVYTWSENLVDPQRWNRYAYVRNNPLKFVDPDGRDALWVTSPDGKLATLVIPVHFVGKGATPDVIRNIEQRANHLGTGDPLISVLVIATDKPIGGVLNTMDLSQSRDLATCGQGGECANELGGTRAHIDTSQPGAEGAGVHDTLHFSGIREAYDPVTEHGVRTGAVPKPGYSDSNIMASRNGTRLTPVQLQQAKDNPSTKACTLGANGVLACGK
ncbi:MAG: RHS repeat-associated core domain-containing protein [Acidobacteria bacterium]|nr:RHS repeat-associated core domain-containing protein [Acidobacteriota bacterium]